MNNLEYYKEEIVNSMERAWFCSWFLDFGKNIRARRLNDCDNCMFREGVSCAKNKVNWLLAEHKEEPKLTANEKKFLELLNKNYKYIAKDKDGRLYYYSFCPDKKEEEWHTFGDEFSSAIYIEKESFKNVNFPMINWEDEKPWKIEDLLKLEVVE